ncbi:MAG: hypothetical protein ABI823_07710 [Bryobacteraceae bacterium]
MLLGAFTLFHVVLSLIGIGTGLVVAYGLLQSQRMEGWTSWFLWTTVATSVTGFMFPVDHITPGHILGVLSLILLTFAILARNKYKLAGRWLRTYVITSMIALYFNVFVLIVQLFQKAPLLKELAPTQTEAPFAVAQLVALLVFAALIIRAAMKFHVDPPRTV